MRRVDRAQALTYWSFGGNFNVHPSTSFRMGGRVKQVSAT